LHCLYSDAKKFPSFRLHMETEVVDLLIEDERVIGVRAKTPRGELDVHANLVIGADGRHSIVQAHAGLQRREFGVPIDVLWMRISKKPDDPEQSFGFFQHGKLLVLLDRGDYSSHSGRRLSGELARGQITHRSSFGGRFAKGAGPPRMADASDSRPAGLDSSPSCHRSGIRWQEIVAVRASFAEMFSDSATT